MSYVPSRFAYKQDVAVWLEGDVVGKRYNADAIILDVKWQDDDNFLVLMVEEDDDNLLTPFAIYLINLDALDIRTEVTRADTLRYAVIEWEALP